MLINTVILFIKDLLPIFVLFCFISTCVTPNKFNTKKLFFLLSTSLTGIIATFYFMPTMGELFNGIGLEIIQTGELLLVYFCLLFASSYLITQKKINLLQSFLIACGAAFFIILNGSAFILFIDSYTANSESIKNIVAGIAIGLGICLSFSALLYFLLRWFITKALYLLTYLLWSLFLSGQVSQIVNLLQQVDIIQSSKALWDSSNVVQDSSEYGHLLKTLFGYEARPSMEFIMLYAISLLIFFCYFLLHSPTRHPHSIDSVKGDSYAG